MTRRPRYVVQSAGSQPRSNDLGQTQQRSFSIIQRKYNRNGRHHAWQKINQLAWNAGVRRDRSLQSVCSEHSQSFFSFRGVNSQRCPATWYSLASFHTGTIEWKSKRQTARFQSMLSVVPVETCYPTTDSMNFRPRIGGAAQYNE